MSLASEFMHCSVIDSGFNHEIYQVTVKADPSDNGNNMKTSRILDV